MNCREQAIKIYETCVASARTGSTLTYRELLDSLRYSAPATGKAIRYGLELARIACAYSNLPPITSIVVNKLTGLPSAGYTPAKWASDTQEAFDKEFWPSVDDIDWEYVWKNRAVLSRKYGTTGYWTR
jgi:hypothetical protein